MPNLASWIRRSDEKWFASFFRPYPTIKVRNAARAPVALAEMDGLLLTGGADIAPEFLHQPMPDASILEKPDRPRDSSIHLTLAATPVSLIQ